MVLALLIGRYIIHSCSFDWLDRKKVVLDLHVNPFSINIYGCLITTNCIPDVDRLLIWPDHSLSLSLCLSFFFFFFIRLWITALALL